MSPPSDLDERDRGLAFLGRTDIPGLSIHFVQYHNSPAFQALTIRLGARLLTSVYVYTGHYRPDYVSLAAHIDTLLEPNLNRQHTVMGDFNYPDRIDDLFTQLLPLGLTPLLQPGVDKHRTWVGYRANARPSLLDNVFTTDPDTLVLADDPQLTGISDHKLII